ncbi:oxidoreductase [Phaeosphaeriaceae sp. PMI808]|nr:oxidoreductase [Phaeosphaeriaceae sp. PMI808]
MTFSHSRHGGVRQNANTFCRVALLFASIYAAHATPSDISGQPLLGSSFGTPFNSTYDYVIVGGGTAGLALANRLSSSGTHTVGVIEAGSFYEFDNGNQSQIPRYAGNGAESTFDNVNPLVDWGFETQPEEGAGGKKLHYTRGKTLGGSSSRNFMFYHRPTKGSADKWADDVGDEGYRWEKFRTFYDRSVTFNPADTTRILKNSTPPYDPAGEKARSGPVQISYSAWVMPFTSWALKALEGLGMKQIPGYLNGELIGSSWAMHTKDPKTMTRFSSEVAYLRPALKRPNLIVHHSTMALKLQFEGTEAVGVACSTRGKKFTLTAKKEVIVSAGAFQSPQLLMVSGIGPRETLEKFGIPVLVHAPGVGQDMEDHPILSVTHKVIVESSTVLDSQPKRLAATEAYIRDGSGPLGNFGGDLLGWEKLPSRLLTNTTYTALSSAPSDWPDIEYLGSSNFPGSPPDKGDYTNIGAVLIKAFSRGTVSIQSASMLDPPIIHVNFLTDPRDQEVAIAALRRIREIFAQPSLSPVLVADSETFPGKSAQTDAQLLQHIQKNGRTISHVSCTCKMGKKGNKMAVVDSEGRVFGTTRLRVVDLSAIPFLPPGHPTATVYALAELISDRILKQEK